MLLATIVGLLPAVVPSHHGLIRWKVQPSILKLTPVTNPETGGTGFVLNTNKGRVILTNAHVCRLMVAKVVAAYVSDSPQPIMLRIKKISDKTDLCLLEGAPSVPALNMGSEVSKGDQVSIVGFPLFDPMTHSEGYVISETIVMLANERTEVCHDDEITTLMGDCLKFFSAYLTTALTFPGNSGSPVVNAFGNVVGIIFAGNTMSNKGYFIGIEEIQRFLAE